MASPLAGTFTGNSILVELSLLKSWLLAMTFQSPQTCSSTLTVTASSLWLRSVTS
ncbi:hypothetical protein D3C79_1089720 [compost metagenome]